MGTTEAGKASMPVPFLDANAARKGTAPWLEMTQEQGGTYNASPPASFMAADKYSRGQQEDAGLARVHERR